MTNLPYHITIVYFQKLYEINITTSVNELTIHIISMSLLFYHYIEEVIKISVGNQRIKLPLALIALLISAFAIGTTEFVIMGILPDVANDLNVTLSAAGLLVIGYWLRARRRNRRSNYHRIYRTFVT